jgi:hypothetical protein
LTHLRPRTRLTRRELAGEEVCERRKNDRRLATEKERMEVIACRQYDLYVPAEQLSPV